jgi:phenylacetate-CoA ligase
MQRRGGFKPAPTEDDALMTEPLIELKLPRSRNDIAAIQRDRKRRAVENAKRSGFWQGKLDHVRLDRLDDPEEWRKIPILDKDMLRALPPEAFYRDFCIAPRHEVAEYWRSGGATGKPLFYPRTFADIHYAMIGFRRTYECMGCKPGDQAHLSFPLGIHPAGHMWARAGELAGLGMIWAGAGAACPSNIQIELMQMLKPTVWMGMSSYGLHLANLAEQQGIDLAAGPVERILCTAEPLSDAKRQKLARHWGAKVYDAFGMTEVTMMGAESERAEGFHIWTDLAFIEVLDPKTGEPVPEGAEGTLVVTPLFTNHATPFLRWSTGDIVRYREHGSYDGPFSVFPLIKHAHRTAGFFKIRGININHSEFEDFMFADSAVGDFKAELIASDGLDQLRLCVEFRQGVDTASAAAAVEKKTKMKFEVTPMVVVLGAGTLAREFESSVKAPRFVDARK